MTSNVETAATVDPNDPASVQQVADIGTVVAERGDDDLRLHVEAVWRDDRRPDHHACPSSWRPRRPP